MKNVTKALLLLALLSFIVFVVVRLGALEAEIVHYVPLGVGAIFLILGLIFDIKLLLEFLTLKTTKHGMSMGLVFLLFLALVTGLNYIALKENRSWDFTEESLYSLSEQTETLLKGLSEELVFKGFFIKSNPQHIEVKARFLDQVKLLKEVSDLVRVKISDPVLEPQEARSNDISEGGGIVVSYKGNQAKIDASLTEQDFLDALIKVTREADKALYFLEKHAEVDLNDESEKGAKIFKDDLEGSRYQVKSLNLIDSVSVPKDADAVFVLGPQHPLLSSEVDALEEYLKHGGNLFIAIDPGVESGLKKLLSKLGIKFQESYILDDAGTGSGGLSFSAFGQEYSKTHEVTKGLPESISNYFLASGFEISHKIDGFTYDEIVRTGPMAMSTDRLDAEMKVAEKGPFTLAVSVTGEWPGSKEMFQVLLFADSDFVVNTQYINFLNRDIALNSVAYLAKDKDLITLRPKRPESTALIGVTKAEFQLFNLFPFVMLPLVMILSGAVLYFRRKGA